MDVRSSNFTPYCHIYLSYITIFLSLMQTIQEVDPHPHIAPCVNMWGVTFLFLFCFFLCLCDLSIGGACICHIAHGVGQSGLYHTIKMLHFVLFHSVTCYTNSKVSRIHVNTTELRNTTCALVVTSVILRSLECMIFNVTMVTFQMTLLMNK